MTWELERDASGFMVRRSKEVAQRYRTAGYWLDTTLVDIARALASQPKLLMMDEPAAGLNDAETDNLAAMIERLKGDGITMLVVEHDIDFIMNACDKIVVMDRGAKIADDVPAKVRADERVISAYIGRKDAHAAR